MARSTTHLGIVLKKLISDSDLSLRELADELKISHTNLYQLTEGQRCSHEVLRKLSSHFRTREAQQLLLIAHLRDEADATGLDPSCLDISAMPGVVVKNLNMSTLLEGYLEVLARRLAKEENLPEKERIFTSQIEWLSEAITRQEAFEADATAKALHNPIAAREKKREQAARSKQVRTSP